jgi:parallel beta-helix repeat protein
LLVCWEIWFVFERLPPRKVVTAVPVKKPFSPKTRNTQRSLKDAKAVTLTNDQPTQKRIWGYATVLALLLSPLPLTQVPEIGAQSSKTIIVPDDYLTIQAAIDAASDGDTVFVKTGYYTEDPVVNKSISLIGKDPDSAILDVVLGITVESNNVAILNLNIFNGWHGITVLGNSCRILGNKIDDADLMVWGHNAYISGNLIKSTTQGITLIGTNNYLSQNRIESCSEGIWVSGGCKNRISENTITNCDDIAIRLLGANDNTITLNNITYSGYGTTIYGANRNTISQNNYVGNTVHLSANEDYLLTFGVNRSINTISENFWSSFSGGRDSNSDGIWDKPYIIDEFNRDNSPRTRPISTQSTPTPTPDPTVSPTYTPSPTTPIETQTPTPTSTQTPLPSMSNDNPNETPWYLIAVGTTVGFGLMVLFGVWLKRKHLYAAQFS